MRQGPTRRQLKALFPIAWQINDHLHVQPDQSVEFTGSTNDVDAFRAMLHKIDPHFDLGTEHEGIDIDDEVLDGG